MPPTTYDGLFWETVIPENDRQQILDLLRGEQAAAQLCALPYQTWTLDTGEFCLGIALPGISTIPAGFVASSGRLRTVPTVLAPDQPLLQARQSYQDLRKVVSAHLDSDPGEGELLCVSARAANGGLWRGEEGATLLDCLMAFDAAGLSLFAVQCI